mmetsp:Transcript_19144/g.47774  ORF Transcript_19144/g.47774 Transcript_19144/m.47774 type:complete len:306 (+) Transcript_19144:4673-5590(+)
MCMLTEDKYNNPVQPLRPRLNVTNGSRRLALQADPESVRENVKTLCLGQSQCTVPATRSLFGVVKDGGAAVDNNMALSAVVECVPPDLYDEQKAADQLSGYGLSCLTGCPTCVASTSENVTVECDSSQVIFDIRDVVWGAAHEAPKWQFDPFPGLCNVSATAKIPRGNMCEAGNVEDFKRNLRRRCLGRTQCQINKSELMALSGVKGEPCAGFDKSFRVIATCRRQQLPFAAQDMPTGNSFGLLHYESRMYTSNNAAVSLTDGFLMRVAFQSSGKKITLKLRSAILEIAFLRFQSRFLGIGNCPH